MCSFFDVIDVQKLREAFDYDSHNDWSGETDYEVICHLSYLLERAILKQSFCSPLIEELLMLLYDAKSQGIYPQWRIWEEYLKLAADAVNYEIRKANNEVVL